MENDLTERAAKRYAEKGVDDPPKVTFFRTKTSVQIDHGIRGVVDWARTERGGRQLGLFEPDYPQEGCMRWGLCDSPPGES